MWHVLKGIKAADVCGVKRGEMVSNSDSFFSSSLMFFPLELNDLPLRQEGHFFSVSLHLIKFEERLRED